MYAKFRRFLDTTAFIHLIDIFLYWESGFLGSEDKSAAENGSSLVTKKSRNKRLEIEIDFAKPYGNEISDVFAPPKNPKSLLLPANRAPSNTTLPEDCHYQPEDLVKLFLLPNVMVILVTYIWTCSIFPEAL